jgi:ABC-type histidine transport system ATPase subunit
VETYPRQRGALKNIADALGVSADVLLSDDKIMIKDKELLKRFEVVQEMTRDDKNIVLKFLDLTLRDFKTKKAYS